MNKTDILMSYIYNQSVFLRHEIDRLQENIRWRNISDVDCMELIIAKARYDAFVQFGTDVCRILKLGRFDDITKSNLARVNKAKKSKSSE